MDPHRLRRDIPCAQLFRPLKECGLTIGKELPDRDWCWDSGELPGLLSQNQESEVIEMTQRMDSWDVSLESPVREDSEDQQKNFIPTGGPSVEETVADFEIKERMVQILTTLKTTLNDKEISILEDRLLSDEPDTLQDIADKYGISRERVRQIESNLLKKMKKYLEQEVPDIHNFLDLYTEQLPR